MADKTLTPLTNAEVQAFCSQMSMILKSGISSTEGISIMLDDSQNKEEQERSAERYRRLSGLFRIHDPDW